MITAMMLWTEYRQENISGGGWPRNISSYKQFTVHTQNGARLLQLMKWPYWTQAFIYKWVKGWEAKYVQYCWIRRQKCVHFMWSRKVCIFHVSIPDTASAFWSTCECVQLQNLLVLKLDSLRLFSGAFYDIWQWCTAAEIFTF